MPRLILTSTEGRCLVRTHNGLAFLEDDRYTPVTFANMKEVEAERARILKAFPDLTIAIQEYKP